MGTWGRIADWDRRINAWDRRTTERVVQRHRWLSWIDSDAAGDRWIWKRRTTARIAALCRYLPVAAFLVGSNNRNFLAAAVVILVLLVGQLAFQLDARAKAYERDVVLPEDKRLERDAR